MKKFTVCIAMYNQIDYIETAIRSVLDQTYPNIEIIIADDCSKDFNKNTIKKIFDKYNKNNYKYKIIHNDKNLGIVKNLNNVVINAKGDYILLFAADDKLYDDKVISNFVEAFEKNSSVNIITSQCLLYDCKLEKINGVFVDRNEAFEINSYSSRQQYIKLCEGCIYGAGATAYKKEVLAKYNYFDESYKHVEDWSNWLRFLRNGEKIYYEDFITLCHRDGGISHNKSKKVPPHVREYYNDMAQVYKKEILGNLKNATFNEKVKIFNIIMKKFLHRKKQKNLDKYRGKHAFVICAYKEQKNIEDCIISLINQTLKSDIYISTSTPNKFLSEMSKKYNIKLFINRNKSNHIKDFNYAYTLVDTKYVTLCHQDDIYLSNFAEETVKKMEKQKRPVIAFTNYWEYKNNKIIKKNALLIIKRIINSPLLLFKKSKKVKMLTLSIGNAICAPTVTYNKLLVSKPVVDTEFKSNIDWISYIEFAKIKGSFVYIKKPLLLRRIHKESTTTKVIANTIKRDEDYIMFRKFWPEKIAKILLKIYSSSEKSNNIK